MVEVKIHKLSDYYPLIEHDKFAEVFENIRNLRNDPRVKSGFIEQCYIEEDEHKEFMLKNFKNFIVACANDNFAGYAGVINNDIRVCVHPDYQGIGVGKKLINELTLRYPHAKAVIKVDNLASQKLFESCGFGRKEEFYLYKKS